MEQEYTYQRLLSLFALTDDLAELISKGDVDTRSYFITLINIENIFDTYGRGLVRQSAIDSGKSDEEASVLVHQATEQMERLRVVIRKLAQANDFDEVIKDAGEKMYEDWHKLPDDHPNASAWL